MRRFVVAPGSLTGKTVTFPVREARHLARVLRLARGQVVEVIDTTGQVALVELVRVDPREVRGQVIRRWHETIAGEVILAQGIIRAAKMDLIVEKATELGVTSLVPLASRHVRARYQAIQRRPRWQRISEAACKQSGRAAPIRIHDPVAWPDILSFPADQRVICVPGVDNAPLVASRFSSGSLLVLVGPEGGFHHREVEEARAAGFFSLDLGPLILRAETAAIAAISILQWLRLGPNEGQ